MDPNYHLLGDFSFVAGFTTSTGLKSPALIHVPLDDASLGVHKVSARTAHPSVQPPPPSVTSNSNDFPPPELSWQASYPAGSCNPSGPIPGGFGFYLSGPPSSEFTRQLAGATEVLFSYRMMLQEGWEWVKGGKLPGVYGGVGTLAYGCTGGRKEERCQCFNIRPMWRANALGELYAYLPLTPSNQSAQLAIPPLSIQNPDYGFSIGRGAFDFDSAVGRWMAVRFRVRLNDVGECNGEIELWIDGKSVMNIQGLTLRDSDEGRIKGMHFQTFFGGHGADWATPKDQRAWFADLTGAIIR